MRVLSDLLVLLVGLVWILSKVLCWTVSSRLSWLHWGSLQTAATFPPPCDLVLIVTGSERQLCLCDFCFPEFAFWEALKLPRCIHIVLPLLLCSLTCSPRLKAITMTSPRQNSGINLGNDPVWIKFFVLLGGLCASVHVCVVFCPGLKPTTYLNTCNCLECLEICLLLTLTWP